MEDWYNVTRKDFLNNYGKTLIGNKYNSNIQLLKSIFSEYEWLPWKFATTTKGFWDDIENHKIYSKWLGKQLGYTSMEDWYKVSYIDFTYNYGAGLVSIAYNSSVKKLLLTLI